MSDAFSFSPRPNRASEIAWQPWGAEPFALAKSLDKPVLLSLSAVWCHWCHVMDETSYSDPAVIATINDGFVPVRVDADRRPDVDARYNLGGWPTTAILTPQGDVLTGGTYVPPPAMRAMLEQVAGVYRSQRGEIERELAARRARGERAAAQGVPTGIDEAIVARTFEAIARIYDDEYGGFGEEPKFPMTDVLEFLLLSYRLDGNHRALEMLETTARAMASGGTYDHVEGGFFRYSTTRDWSVPHFEKMSDDHAGLLRAFAGLSTATRDAGLIATLHSTLAYVRGTLRDPVRGLFAGSQDADEEYYALPRAERALRTAPFVDRTVYVSWNANLASALFAAALALDDDGLAAEATAAVDALDAQFRAGRGLYYHYRAPGGSPQAPGLLGDQVFMLTALLDAHAFTGEARFRERAADLADAVQTAFSDGGGAFVDRAANGGDGAAGLLSVARRPLRENAFAADALLRLGAITGDARWGSAARQTLADLAGEAAASGPFAAPHARAALRALRPAAAVTVVGTGDGAAALRAAALRLPYPLVAVASTADDAAAGLPRDGRAAALACRGTACAAPAFSASDLRDAFDRLARPE